MGKSMLLDKFIRIFAKAKYIKCEALDNITGGLEAEDFSASIVHSQFIEGLKDMVRKMEQHKWHKLKKIVFTTSWNNKIKNDCNLYATQFAALGWHIGKGSKTIVLAGNPYEDFSYHFFPKISFMIQGEPPQDEVTSLDVPILRQLIARSNIVSLDMQQRWAFFTDAQQSIEINIQYLYKHYAALTSLFLSPYIKNLLLFDQISEMFPNAIQIISEDTNCIFIKDSGWIETFSPSIVNANFMLGLQQRISMIPCYAKLQKIIIRTLDYAIKLNYIYVQQFDTLGWDIQVENKKHGWKTKAELILTKKYFSSQVQIQTDNHLLF